MTRLTNELRRDIVNNAVKNAFADEKKKLNEENVKIGDAIYRLMVSEKKEALLRDAGREFVEFGDGVNVKTSPTTYRATKFKLSCEKPVAIRMKYGNNVNESLTEKMMARCQAWVAKKDALDEKDTDLRHQVRSLIAGFNTVKTLVAAWPEGERFIPKDAAAPKPLLPALVTDDINKALKLAGAFKERVEEAVAA